MFIHHLTRITAAAAIILALAPPALAAEDEARARELINALGCKGCHRINGDGGNLGPALDKVGSRLTTGQIRAKLIAPKQADPASIMPAYPHLSEEDLKILAEHLGNLK